MVRSKRIISLILAVIIPIVAVCSVFVIASHYNHFCDGADCRECIIIEQFKGILSLLGMYLPFILVFVLLMDLSAHLYKSANIHFTANTLVLMKVKFSD